MASSGMIDSSVEYARRIWEQDNTVYHDLDHVVEWIGDGKPSSNLILETYMTYFDFKNMCLEQSFRNLCSRLHLKGETQQIDRILLQFSIRYFECNPKCIFGTIDVVHAIVYSLLLLNTDLHVAQGDYKKMSRSAFVKNTMSAIHAQLETPAADMDDHRTSSGLSFQSLDWIPLQRTSSNQSAFSTRSSTYAPSSIDSGSMSRPSPIGSKSWQVEVKSLLKQMYTSLRHSQITNPSNYQPNTNNNNNTNRMSTAFKRSVGTIIWKGNNNNNNNTATRDSIVVVEDNSISSVQSTSSSVMQYQSVASHLQHTDIPTCYTSNAPYYKEGMVVRKHLLERTGQKAKYRDWRDCFMVIDRSQARMYKLDTTSSGQHNSNNNNNNNNNKRQTLRSTIMSRSNSTFSDSASQMSSTSDYNNTVVGGGDWMSHSQFMGSVDLKHTLANALPSGYSRQRQHAFALQQSNGAVFLFQVGSVEQVYEWVSTCNYWAARESKEPLKGGVSSMEYGWGDCLLVEEGVPIINEWEAPTPMMSSSILDEQTQLEVLSRYVQELSIELDQHRDIKPKMENRFRTLPKLNLKVMSNWEAKSHYLLHEIIKFQNYCDSIEKSLQLQQEIMLPL